MVTGNRKLQIRLTADEWHLIYSMEPECFGQGISEKARHKLLQAAAEEVGYKGLFKDIDGRIKVPATVTKKTTRKEWPR